jgi:hypothetical protein
MKSNGPNADTSESIVQLTMRILGGLVLADRQQSMRNLFYILLAAMGFIAGRGYSAADVNSNSLSFYVVSDAKIDGGKFIDTLDFPKLGYIAAEPDLVITQLLSVSNNVFQSQIDRPTLDLQISPEDAKQFETLTQNNLGKQVLLMLGDTPLIAPRIIGVVSTQNIQVTIGRHSNRKLIEAALKKLVH